jgi:hypothetical protein
VSAVALTGSAVPVDAAPDLDVPAADAIGVFAEAPRADLVLVVAEVKIEVAGIACFRGAAAGGVEVSNRGS